jgi:chaperone modulatory protein CbpM
MDMENLIPANDFCINHNIEISFIYLLHKTGLIEITNIEETIYIPISQLNQLEKMVRFYYEMDINIEGIETISHLLKQMNDMQNEIINLKNKLRLYEVNE